MTGANQGVVPAMGAAVHAVVVRHVAALVAGSPMAGSVVHRGWAGTALAMAMEVDTVMGTGKGTSMAAIMAEDRTPAGTARLRVVS